MHMQDGVLMDAVFKTKLFDLQTLLYQHNKQT
jgi:hypothetical protein